MQTLWSGRAICAISTIGSVQAGDALRPGWARDTLRTLWAGRTIGTIRAIGAVQAGYTLRPSWPWN